ncbi:MAG: DNA alkylation repair protein [Algisphaera sp.]
MGMDLKKTIGALERLADPGKVVIKQEKFGITADHSLGIYHGDLKVLAKEIGTDHDLALALMKAGIYEARLLGSKVVDPGRVTPALMDQWAVGFENWEICDSFCMGVFVKSEHAMGKLVEWSAHEGEFVKRAAFTMMAAYGFANKNAANDVFESFLPLIEREAMDSRLYVKKAVNWALRNIGKRNEDLWGEAITAAHRILKRNSPSAQWIARHALRQLQNPNMKKMDYPRSIYRYPK